MTKQTTIDAATYQRLLKREEAKEQGDVKTKTARRKPRHRESELQRHCVAWFRSQYREYKLVLFAVPNGGHRDATEAKIMQAEGVTPGVADLLLLVARGGYHGLCIEMKVASSSSRQSPRQREWQQAIESQGYRYVVARSLDEFRQVVNEYMSMK